MGLLELIKGSLGVGQAEEKEVAEVNGQPIKVIEVGSSGTEVYGGYISEEYLAELRGRDWADKVDQMRRSDANVRMSINSLKLPLKSSNWYFNKLEESPEAELQKLLLEKALFEDIDRSFTKLLGEILTCLEFGYSLFEITYKAKLGDADLGNYNTLKSISFRSQRTIEKWNIDQSGKVLTVTQLADGDVGRSVNLDARFLLHFCPDQEGDNFEGISVLRGMYGSWLRKNHFLKLMAAGIEKYAIPIPILEIPEGKESSPEYANAIKALQKYTSNQSNYITFPQGWKLDIKTTTFEAEKIRNTIEFENREMVNSILASFLILGQGGASGNRSLGDTLSDFFAQTLRYIADHISEQMEQAILKPLVKMNFGDRPLLVEFRCDGLDEKADKVWADTLKVLTDSGVVNKDVKLEEFVRQKFKLPELEEILQAPIGTAQFSEKKKTKQGSAAADLMRATSQNLTNVFDSFVKVMGTDYIESIMRNYDSSNASGESRAANVASISLPDDYVEAVRFYISYANLEAKQQVKKLFPGKGKRLAEFRLAVDATKKLDKLTKAIDDKLADFQDAADDYYRNPSPETKRLMRNASQNLARVMKQGREIVEDYLSHAEVIKNLEKTKLTLESQIADVKKGVGLQFQSSLSSTDSSSLLKKDLQDSLKKVVSGPIVRTGPDIIASQTINEARLLAAEEANEEQKNLPPDERDEIESYTFVAEDDDRTSEICLELNGRTFAPDDPDVWRFHPPLHHNCRSTMVVNLKSFKANPSIDDNKLNLSKAAQKAITLSEAEDSDETTNYVSKLRSQLQCVELGLD
jgi:SPP1 gp7 family putative phage head morphogenesis protein